MSDKYNCPNCGAPIGYTDRCQYCGTILNWFPTMTEVFFVPMHLRERSLQVSCTLPIEHAESIGAAQIYAQIAKELAVKLPKVWELHVKDNPFDQTRHYLAKLYVYEPVKKGRADRG